MKKCSYCKTNKAVTEFNTSRTQAGGFQALCRDCAKAYYKAYNASRKAAKQSVDLQSKVCRDCGLEKPISQFGKKSNLPDKHNIYCKPCWRHRCLIAVRKHNAKSKG
jgi:protein-arginine kinase activator protein McsA